MSDFGLAIVVAITGWWFFTGLILWLVHRFQSIHRWIFALATGLMVVALIIAGDVALDTSPQGAVIGFCLALVLWGWLEMGYLMGFVTGPVNQQCPQHARLAQRLYWGVGTSLYHELALIVVGSTLLLLTFDAPNKTALWSFLTLWAMRWSAKLNLVLGVRNYNIEWLPSHLAYLDSYIPRRRINGLFPISVIAGIAATAWLFTLATGSHAIWDRIAFALVATLMALGTLEHLFLMLPLHDAALWRWAAPNGASGAAKAPVAEGEPSKC